MKSCSVKNAAERFSAGSVMLAVALSVMLLSLPVMGEEPREGAYTGANRPLRQCKPILYFSLERPAFHHVMPLAARHHPSSWPVWSERFLWYGVIAPKSARAVSRGSRFGESGPLATSSARYLRSPLRYGAKVPEVGSRRRAHHFHSWSERRGTVERIYGPEVAQSVWRRAQTAAKDFCGRCSAEVEKIDNFCSQCGEKIQ